MIPEFRPCRLFYTFLPSFFKLCNALFCEVEVFGNRIRIRLAKVSVTKRQQVVTFACCSLIKKFVSWLVRHFTSPNNDQRYSSGTLRLDATSLGRILLERI